jgi:exonuclease SbcD
LRILHTADWHVGRPIKGRSRADEHRAVLAEIAGIAARERVDLAIVAGDLFDLAAPSPESEEIVYGALLALADAGAHVVVVSGNHDHPRRFEAIKPLLARTGRVHAGATLARPDDGGVLTLETAGGETARIALFPFLSQRGIVTADALMSGDAGEHAQTYAGRCAAVVRALCQPFGSDSVNLFVGHLLAGGAVGSGSERGPHMHDDYRVPTDCFDHGALHYVALGHVHAPQRVHVATGCPAWYCGSPLQLDFGESANEPCVLVIHAQAGKPAEIERHALTAGRRLRTIRGSLESLAGEIDRIADDYLRVEVTDAPRPGLADQVRALCPERVMEVRPVGAAAGGGAAGDQDAVDRLRRSPRELFAEYLEAAGKNDPRLLALFDQLLEEAHAADAS